MLMISNCKCTQILYEFGNCMPTFIDKGMVIESDTYRKVDKTNFVPFEMSVFQDNPHVILIRQYALGDVLQLVWVVRKMKEFYNIKRLTIMTSESYAKKLQPIYPDLEFAAYQANLQFTGTTTMILNGHLEKDHNPNNVEAKMHRINILNRNLGMPQVTSTKAEDWEFKRASIRFEGDEGVKYVGLQIRGSNPIKTLPYDYVQSLARRLSQDYKVVLLDHDVNKGFSGENIIDTCGKLDVRQCVSLLAQMSAVITMDSGMLWMAHSANVPTLLLLGSTREEERLTLHPQFPQKAKSISLSNMVNCKPCFETREHCKGKHTCMNDFPRELLTEKILENLNQIIGV